MTDNYTRPNDKLPSLKRSFSWAKRKERAVMEFAARNMISC